MWDAEVLAEPVHQSRQLVAATAREQYSSLIKRMPKNSHDGYRKSHTRLITSHVLFGCCISCVRVGVTCLCGDAGAQARCSDWRHCDGSKDKACPQVSE